MIDGGGVGKLQCVELLHAGAAEQVYERVASLEQRRPRLLGEVGGRDRRDRDQLRELLLQLRHECTDDLRSRGAHRRALSWLKTKGGDLLLGSDGGWILGELEQLDCGEGGERAVAAGETDYARSVDGGGRSRTAALAERLTTLRERGEALPGAPLAREVLTTERELGGGLIAGGVAFRIFLWLVPFGLVVAAVLSFWTELDPDGLENAARRFGIGAAAAQAASEALQAGDRSAYFVLAFGLFFLAWFTIGAVRALVLAHALAWQLEPPRIRRPFRAVAIFNGLFLVAILSAVGVTWLEAQLGRTALVGTLLTLVLTTGVALVAMWMLPHRATDVRELLPGALLVTVGHQLIQIAVIFYFAPRLGRSEETYGAFGAAATMLVWLYVLSRLVTGAAFLNATLWARRQSAAAG